MRIELVGVRSFDAFWLESVGIRCNHSTEQTTHLRRHHLHVSAHPFNLFRPGRAHWVVAHRGDGAWGWGGA
jgi:hypothetical protein